MAAAASFRSAPAPVLGFVPVPAGVFGVVFLLVAAAFGEPLGWGRGLFLILLLVITGPATAHAIGSAANRIGLPRKGAERDDLVYTSKSKS